MPIGQFIYNQNCIYRIYFIWYEYWLFSVQLQDTTSMLKYSWCFRKSAYVQVYQKDHNVFEEETNPISGMEIIMIKYGYSYS